ncbi:MAG: N-acetylmuramoyl-L-alanine amidase [Pseudomonadota bacterium]
MLKIVRFCLGFVDGLLKGLPLLLAAAWIGGAGAAAGSQATLKDVRFGENGDVTRIVLDLSEEVGYRAFALTGGDGRIVIDLERLDYEVAGGRWLAGQGLGEGKGRGHVSKFRYAHNSQAASRIVLDLKRPAIIKEAFGIPPSGQNANYRLVIDLKAADGVLFAASLDETYGGWTPPTVVATPTPASASKAKKIIVIDSGHGGRDPGAIGPKNTYEKTLTLAAGLKLKDILERRGLYDVVLTRDSDEFLDLEERTQIARAAGADLFISLHADANRNLSVRGSSVYTLSEKASDEYAKKVRAEGNYHIIDDANDSASEVEGILFDLARRETKNQSARFAEVLIPELVGATKVVNNTHRRAGYRVLLAPDVPAVLLEMAFLSNAEDEKLLRNPAWRNNLMVAVADAIDAYFSGRGMSEQVRQAAAGAAPIN